MSDRTRPAAAKTLTRRRDDNPVKISKAFVVSWYPSGILGGKNNPRRQQRCGNGEAAEDFAAKKYVEIARHRVRGPLSHVSLGEVMSRFVQYLGATNTPQGTTDQYRSNWNCHVPETVADVGISDLDASHWTWCSS